MPNITIPPSVMQAVSPLMTRRVAYGAAISLAVGIGLGAWLQPPAFHYGAVGSTIVTPPEQSELWSHDDGSASALPYSQPESSPGAFQTASVSPPSGDAPMAQPAVQTSAVASAQEDADPAPVRVAYNSRPQAAPAVGRDWADQAGPDRADNDSQDAPPPPRWERPLEPRWSPPPEGRPSMQDRRWDFRPDGSAVPVDDGGG